MAEPHTREALSEAVLRPRQVWALAALLIAALLAPGLVDRHGLALLITVLFWAAFSGGWNIIGGYAGQFSLGHAAFFAMGAYASAWTYTHLGVSPLFGVAAGIVVAGAMAAILGAVVFRYKLLGTYFAIGTLAFSEVLKVVIGNVPWFGGSNGVPIPLATNPNWTLLQFSPIVYYYIFLCLTVAYMAVSRQISVSRFGFQLAALRDNEDVAESLGINPERLKLKAFVLSAILAAPVGAFYAQYVMFVEPSTFLGFAMVIQVVIPSVIGGLATVFGPLVGAALLTVALEVTSRMSTLPGTSLLLYGIALMAFPLFMPEGIWPTIARRWKGRFP